MENEIEVKTEIKKTRRNEFKSFAITFLVVSILIALLSGATFMAPTKEYTDYVQRVGSDDYFYGEEKTYNDKLTMTVLLYALAFSAILFGISALIDRQEVIIKLLSKDEPEK